MVYKCQICDAKLKSSKSAKSFQHINIIKHQTALRVINGEYSFLNKYQKDGFYIVEYNFILEDVFLIAKIDLKSKNNN
jgi:hypothetical protein